MNESYSIYVFSGFFLFFNRNVAEQAKKQKKRDLQINKYTIAKSNRLPKLCWLTYTFISLFANNSFH